MSTADQQLTPAEIRLSQYVQRTSTWSTATHNDGTEKALYEIALGLKGEVDRLRAKLANVTRQRDHWHAEVQYADARIAELTRRTTRVQCGDCGAVGGIRPGDDGRAYLRPSGQIGHGAG
ncbi:hypothetical protein [Streptomyces sp. NPDC006193]|uniref:hypothetical protein n=1 Tax=Streptomyces sp. NPDC006193 TaxID=3155717 RepID=UPI0033B0EDD9